MAQVVPRAQRTAVHVLQAPVVSLHVPRAPQFMPSVAFMQTLPPVKQLTIPDPVTHPRDVHCPLVQLNAERLRQVSRGAAGAQSVARFVSAQPEVALHVAV